MNIANVTSRFIMFSGIDREKLSRFYPLIEDAVNFVESRIRVKNPDEQQRQRIEILCAAYAYKLFCICDEENISGFSAGDVRITTPVGGESRGERLWKELVEKSVDIFDTGKFIFGVI